MKRIVMVEDDVDFAETLKEYLESDDQVRVEAILTNQSDALEWFEKNDLSKIDCALIDLSMPSAPGMRNASSNAGLRVSSELRYTHIFPGLIIVVTNSRLYEDAERAIAAGCDGYLCKHTTTAEISSMVTELKLAMTGNVMLVSREMRHVFIRNELSPKEARLMELVDEGHSWSEIARMLGYKTHKAASAIGYRVFDKVTGPCDQPADSEGSQEFKRQRALEVWRARNRSFQSKES